MNIHTDKLLVPGSVRNCRLMVPAAGLLLNVHVVSAAVSGLGMTQSLWISSSHRTVSNSQRTSFTCSRDNLGLQNNHVSARHASSGRSWAWACLQLTRHHCRLSRCNWQSSKALPHAAGSFTTQRLWKGSWVRAAAEVSGSMPALQSVAIRGKHLQKSAGQLLQPLSTCAVLG